MLFYLKLKNCLYHPSAGKKYKNISVDLHCEVCYNKFRIVFSLLWGSVFKFENL